MADPRTTTKQDDVKQTPKDTGGGLPPREGERNKPQRQPDDTPADQRQPGALNR